MFAQLPLDLQRPCMEVSIVEPAAFVNFQREHSRGGGATGEDAAAAALGTLDCEAMAD